MTYKDDDDFYFRLIFLILFYGSILYAAVAITGFAAAIGSLYGAGHAIKNYAVSFKENVIDSNRKPNISA